MMTILYWVALVGLMLGAWYFLMIRPQRRKTREHEAMMKQLQPGALVVTVAGIYGEVDSVGEDTLVLKLEDGARMKVSRASIAGLEAEEAPEEAEEDEVEEGEAAEDGQAEKDEKSGGGDEGDKAGPQ